MTFKPRIFFGIGLLLCFFVFVVTSFAPQALAADYSWRRSNAYSSKINELDDEVVSDLSVPILFGVTLDMITPNFGDARGDGSRTHEGLDIMAPEGAPIVSPTDAVVTRTGTGANSGKYVSTANPGGETFVYMHLSEISVKGGDVLKEGDLIGLVGNTGNASGGPAHLHFEVRDGRKATDPFLRITREFSIKEKIKFLKGVLEEIDDGDSLADFITENYKTELQQAKTAGIDVPSSIGGNSRDAAVTTSPRTTAVSSDDLDLGSRGPSVTKLQVFLIDKNIGSATKALSDAGATGYFGSITQAALAEYQAKHGITPAVGYYGPKTRAYILANS